MNSFILFLEKLSSRINGGLHSQNKDEWVEEVMTRMNKYWPGAEEFEGSQKIKTEEDYSRLAKQLSRELREKIKESYQHYNRDSLEGIRFTPDHAEYIKVKVESYFEELPLVR